MAEPKKTKSYKQALKNRVKKVKEKEVLEVTPPPTPLKKTRARRKKKEDIVVEEVEEDVVVDTKEEVSPKSIKAWIKAKWPIEDYNRFVLCLETYPAYTDNLYRLFHWTVIMGKGVGRMKEIHDQEIVKGIQLTFRGKQALEKV